MVTIARLEERDDFRLLLEVFVADDAGQYGFYTSGVAVAVYAALPWLPSADEWQVRWELVGYLYRCNACANIVSAACWTSRCDLA